jgi:hypothetical protein
VLTDAQRIATLEKTVAELAKAAGIAAPAAAKKAGGH